MFKVFQSPKSGKLRVEDVPAPRARRGGVVVHNKFSVISAGTEKMIIELSKKGVIQKAKERPDYVQKFITVIKTKGIFAAWNMVKQKLDTDIALGYSSSGIVLEAGADSGEFRAGDRVACAGQNYASHADFVFVPKNLCVKAPANVSLEDASFTTLGAIALQGIRRAELSQGETVAVIGLGLLGQLAVRMLKSYGHPVVGIDINKKQVEFALRGGMDEGFAPGDENGNKRIMRMTGGRGIDAVLIYASSKDDSPLRFAVDISRERGRIVQIGSVLAAIPWVEFYKKELTFVSSRSYGPGRYDHEYEEEGHDYPFGFVRWTEKRNMEEFLRLISGKSISLDNLKTKTFPVEKGEEAYKFVFNPENLVHGVILSYAEKEKQDTFILSEQAAKKRQTDISIALVGAGSFMKSVIIPELIKRKDVSVRAVCDSDGMESKKIAGKFGAEYATSEYEKILKDENVNFIICATRHSSHAEVVIAALRAGKHIYVEKPAAITGEELKKVLEAASKSEGKLFVGFNRRFSPHAKIMKEEFSGIGTPLQIIYRVNAGCVPFDHWTQNECEGGRMIGEGCHFTDLFRFIIGKKPLRVSAIGVPIDGSIRTNDNFSISIEYADGSTGTLFYSSIGNFKVPKEYIEIYGGGKIGKFDDFKNGEIIGEKTRKSAGLWKQNKGYAEELDAFIRAIRGEGEPFSLDDIYSAHIAVIAAAESLKTGKTVYLA